MQVFIYFICRLKPVSSHFLGDLCRTCFHTNLADISNAVAIVGSPFFDNYWVGSYDQGEYTCNLMFVNHSLAAISDGKTSLRVICDGVRPAEMKCNGFPVKKRSDGEPDHGEASPEIAHTSVSPTSTCGKFKSTIVGHKTYYVSDPSLHLDFTNAVCAYFFYNGYFTYLTGSNM